MKKYKYGDKELMGVKNHIILIGEFIFKISGVLSTIFPISRKFSCNNLTILALTKLLAFNAMGQTSSEFAQYSEKGRFNYDCNWSLDRSANSPTYGYYLAYCNNDGALYWCDRAGNQYRLQCQTQCVRRLSPENNHQCENGRFLRNGDVNSRSNHPKSNGSHENNGTNSCTGTNEPVKYVSSGQYHLIIADISSSRVNLLMNRERDSNLKLSTFASQYKVWGAINASFVDGYTCPASNNRTFGRTASYGSWWNKTYYPDRSPSSASLFKCHNKRCSVKFGEGREWSYRQVIREPVDIAVTGYLEIRRKGRDLGGSYGDQRGKTILGVSASGKCVYLMIQNSGVADRSSMGRFMDRSGGEDPSDIINLDGGGSTGLYAKGSLYGASSRCVNSFIGVQY